MVKIKIHRGTNQIGGSIVEVYTENTHIFIDFGSELNANPEDSTDQNMIDMISKSKCDAVLFSHYHGDHVGLLEKIPDKDITGKNIKLGMGLEARKILIRIHKTLIGDFVEDAKQHKKLLEILKNREKWIDFRNKTSFEIGDFKITTVRVDHSAYDAYMFIIEAEGKTIVHTGDYRTHGRLGIKLFPDLEEVLKDKNVNILLSEGTMLERQKEKILTEENMEEKAVELLSKPENKWAFLVCSSTNVESLASFHNAAMRLKRPFVVNYYVYEQIMAYRKSAGKEDAKLSFWKTYKFEKMDKENPKLGGLTQAEYMKENGFVMLVGKSDSYTERMEYFRDKNPILIYSMWEGYVNKKVYPDTYDEGYGKLLKKWRYEMLHTSGHASVTDIKKMITEVNPSDGIIPIHTTRKEAFEEMDLDGIKVITLNDGEKLEV